MENETRGRNFLITPDTAQVFHVNGTRDNDGVWRYENPLTHYGKIKANVMKYMTYIDKYLAAVDEAGAMDKVKMLRVSPLGALVLHSLDIITVEHFQAAVERSSGYFDIPETELSDTHPVRVAQNPIYAFRVIDERGYLVSDVGNDSLD